MIRVPLLNQEAENKFVEVQQTQLPSDVSQMINFLSQEKASIEYWLEIALMYYRSGATDKFSQLLGEALREEEFDSII